MISKKHIGDDSFGFQAERDLMVNVGLTVTEVEKLTQLFLKENFPQLRQDAMEAAQSHVTRFLSEFESQLTRRFPQVDTGRFSDPDVQYTLNEAVIETAKRGEQANIDILVTLVLERVTKGTEELFSLACSDAVRVVPRLTRPQIDFLSIMMFFKHMSIPAPEFTSITDYEKSTQLAYPIVKTASSISGWQKQYLESQRCLVHLPISTRELYKELKSKYSALNNVTPEQIKNDIMEKTTCFREFVKCYEDHRMQDWRMTLVGQLVAAVNMERYIPRSNNLRKMIT